MRGAIELFFNQSFDSVRKLKRNESFLGFADAYKHRAETSGELAKVTIRCWNLFGGIDDSGLIEYLDSVSFGMGMAMQYLDDLVDFTKDHEQKNQNDPNLFNALLRTNQQEEDSIWKNIPDLQEGTSIIEFVRTYAPGTFEQYYRLVHKEFDSIPFIDYKRDNIINAVREGFRIMLYRAIFTEGNFYQAYQLAK